MAESMSTVQREISRSMGEMTTRLEESSDLVGTSLREAGAEATRSFGSAMGALSTAAAEKLHSVLGGLERSSQQLSDSISRAGQHALSAVDRSAERLAEQSGQSERILASTSATLQRLEALLDSAGQTEAGFRAIAPELREASREFALTAERTREGLEAMHGLSRTISDTSTRLSESQAQVREAWSDYIERFQSTDASLKQVFQEVDSGLERFITRISEFNQSFDGHLSSSVNMLGGAIQELGEILEENLGPVVEQRRT
jgi:phage-related minor tail protein